VFDTPHMSPERRFPPPWTVEEYRGITFIVRDAAGIAKLPELLLRTKG
jgi:hypothetical protein